MNYFTEILYNKSLSKTDIVYMLALLDQNNKEASITHEHMAGLLGDSLATSRRTFQSLRKRGFLKQNRKGSTNWGYQITLLAAKEEIVPNIEYLIERNDLPKNDHSQNTKYSNIYNKYIYNNKNNNLSLVNLYKNNKIYKDLTITEGNRRNGNGYPKYYQSHQTFGYPLEIQRKKIERIVEMPLVNAPRDGGLGATIETALEKHESARIKKQNKSTKHYPKVSPDIFTILPNKQLEAKNQKEVSEYNCHDLWYVFRDAWGKRWKGKPKNWRVKEYSMAKDMLKEYSPEDVVGFITYCVENWESICVRFNRKGYPTFVVLYGLRDQLMAEYYNGPLAKVGEYSTNYDHVKSGEWGC